MKEFDEKTRTLASTVLRLLFGNHRITKETNLKNRKISKIIS